MAEIRVKGTGTIKLFESDNTSSVTIASPASLSSDRTITLPDGDVTLATGTMPILTGSTNNTITTVTAANAISGETNLTFDGTDLTVATGNVVMGTSGKGIDFSAVTPTAGMTSQLLDDYEEGTWTPALTDTSDNSPDSESVVGVYTKIGRLVYVNGHIDVGTKGSGLTGSFMRISGFPFTPDDTVTHKSLACFWVSVATGSGSLFTPVYGANPFIYLFETTTDASNDQIAPGDIDDDTFISVNGCYQI